MHRRGRPQDDELLNGDWKQESDGRFGRYGYVEKAFRDAVLLRCLRNRLDNKRRYGYVRSFEMKTFETSSNNNARTQVRQKKHS